MMKYEFLRHIPLFEDMPSDDLRLLCDSIEEVVLPAGSVLFREGEMGDKAYIIQSGQLEILKQAGQHEVRLALRQSGDVIGEMSLLETAPRTASARAINDSRLLALDQHELDQLLSSSATAARALLRTVTARLRATNVLLQQSEKLAQLGTLSAGIAHELNNPAAAIVRSAELMLSVTSTLNAALIDLARHEPDSEQQQNFADLAERASVLAQEDLELDALTRMEREAELASWLEEQGIEYGGDYASVLIETGFTVSELEELAGSFTGPAFEPLIAWLGALAQSFSLLREMKQGAESISEIVKALKSYVYLDQGPVQSVDLKEGLENTLVVMRHKLKQGVTIHREYDESLPKILAYGGELNQVWTNLIDNAVDAMNGQGNLRIRTRQENGYAVVEIEDDGVGIPPEVMPKLFTPFFTTKPQGKGTGLGLSVSYNIIQKHDGMIEAESQPGMTRFTVRLPIR